MLKIEHLTKIYKGNDKKAVDDFSIEVRPGELCGFVGHNGAGKTSAIKCVTGIHGFEGGEIYIDGHSVKKEPMKCKQITAYIPDNPDLYEHLSGMRYINFVADIYRVPKSERDKRIAEYADELGISSALGDPISSYSHGMKQKVALVSAFVHEPKLLVLDEPFVGLDPKAAYVLKQMMQRICEKGSAVFFSTHVLEVVEKLCHSVAILKGGKLLVSGRTEDVIGDESLEEVFLELVDEK